MKVLIQTFGMMIKNAAISKESSKEAAGVPFDVDAVLLGHLAHGIQHARSSVSVRFVRMTTTFALAILFQAFGVWHHAEHIGQSMVHWVRKLLEHGLDLGPDDLGQGLAVVARVEHFGQCAHICTCRAVIGVAHLFLRLDGETRLFAFGVIEGSFATLELE